MVQKTSAKYYNLKRALLFHEPDTRGANNPPRQADITALIPAIYFSESMSSAMMEGNISVLDSTGLLENFPIRGEERLILEIEDSMGNVRVYDLFVYAVGQVDVSAANDLLAYSLEFISYQSFLASTGRIITSHRQKTIKEIADETFDQYYRPEIFQVVEYESAGEIEGSRLDSTNKFLVGEVTDGKFRLIIPKMSTQQAMLFLARRAYSVDSPSCSFRFFESADQFYFVSDEFLIENSNVYEMTYVDNLRRDGLDFVAELNNLEELQNVSRVDTVHDLYSGAYRNRVLELDLVQGRANMNETGYYYFERRDAYFPNQAASGEDLADRHTQRFIDDFQTVENAKTFIVIKDFSEEEEADNMQLRGEQHFKDIVENRVAFREHLNSTTVKAIGPGRLDITVGDIVDLIVSPHNAGRDEIREKNEQLSGKYIVKELERVMEQEVYKNHYTLIKQNWINNA